MEHSLEPLPPHILLPPDDDIRRIKDRLWSPSKCIICSGTRQFKWWNPERTDVVDWACDCEDQFVLGCYLFSRGLMLKQMRTGWGDLVGLPQSGLEWSSEYLSNAHAYASRGIGAVLFGDSGTGKSTMLHLMLRSLMRSGMDGYWIQYRGLMSMVMDGWRDADTQAWFNRRVRNAPVLVVDELGKEHSSEKFAVSVLEETLRYRLGSMMPTFIATNLREDQLEDRYGHSVVEVIQEASSLYAIDGLSWRSNENTRSLSEARAGLSRPIVLG